MRCDSQLQGPLTLMMLHSAKGFLPELKHAPLVTKTMGLLGLGDLTEKAQKRDTFIVTSAFSLFAPASVNTLTLVFVFPQEAA